VVKCCQVPRRSVNLGVGGIVDDDVEPPEMPMGAVNGSERSGAIGCKDSLGPGTCWIFSVTKPDLCGISPLKG
jgi:hypothetical protein